MDGNVKFEITPDEWLVIKVNLRRALDRTRSGRSALVASTHGNLPLWQGDGPHPLGIRINLNVFRPLSRKEQEVIGAGGDPFGE